MQEARLFPFYSKYTIICALAYIIPVFFFFKQEKFSELWLLYLGNSCYGCLLLLCGLFVNKKLHSAASLRSLIMPGLKVIASSITVICVLLAILALSFKSNHLQQAPTNYNGMFVSLALNAVIVNFLLGTLAVFLGAISIKTNQRNEKGEEIT
jgi:hypothetical protein